MAKADPKTDHTVATISQADVNRKRKSFFRSYKLEFHRLQGFLKSLQIEAVRRINLKYAVCNHKKICSEKNDARAITM